MSWNTNGIVNNPAANAILADTGALPSASTTLVNVKLVITATVDILVVFEHRNAANDAVVSQGIPCRPSDSISIDFRGLEYALNERFRLRVFGAVTGNVQGSLFMYWG
jgi:hypothetical protein